MYTSLFLTAACIIGPRYHDIQQYFMELATETLTSSDSPRSSAPRSRVEFATSLDGEELRAIIREAVLEAHEELQQFTPNVAASSQAADRPQNGQEPLLGGTGSDLLTSSDHAQPATLPSPPLSLSSPVASESGPGANAGSQLPRSEHNIDLQCTDPIECRVCPQAGSSKDFPGFSLLGAKKPHPDLWTSVELTPSFVPHGHVWYSSPDGHPYYIPRADEFKPTSPPAACVWAFGLQGDRRGTDGARRSLDFASKGCGESDDPFTSTNDSSAQWIALADRKIQNVAFKSDSRERKVESPAVPPDTPENQRTSYIPWSRPPSAGPPQTALYSPCQHHYPAFDVNATSRPPTSHRNRRETLAEFTAKLQEQPSYDLVSPDLRGLGSGCPSRGPRRDRQYSAPAMLSSPSRAGKGDAGGLGSDLVENSRCRQNMR